MSSNTYNAVKTNTITPYINTQIESRLKQAAKVNMNSTTDLASIYFFDQDGVNTTIPWGSPVNVFNTDINPSYDTTAGGYWNTYTDPASANYGKLKYIGPNAKVSIETTLIYNPLATIETVTTLPAISGRLITLEYTGGRGYDRYVDIAITGPVGSKGATAKATIVDGNITAINVVNRGTGYTYANVNITGSGIEAFATATVNATGGVDTITLTSTKMMASAIPGMNQSDLNNVATITSTYTVTLVPGDIIELKTATTVGIDLNPCRIHAARLQINRPIIKYIN